MPILVSGPSTRRPSTRISPLVRESRPASMSSSVLLPQPDGPTSETKAPGAMARSMGSSALTSPAFER